jgi:hypothetical protein
LDFDPTPHPSFGERFFFFFFSRLICVEVDGDSVTLTTAHTTVDVGVTPLWWYVAMGVVQRWQGAPGRGPRAVMFTPANLSKASSG